MVIKFILFTDFSQGLLQSASVIFWYDCKYHLWLWRSS